MAIQFACPECRQAIEIDDEWGGQTVSCPYCRRVVRAPTESTLEMTSPVPPDVPSARLVPVPPVSMPASSERVGTIAPPPPAGYMPGATGAPAIVLQPNTPGRISLILSILAIVACIVAFVRIAPDLASVWDSVPQDTRPEQQMREVQDRFQQRMRDDMAFATRVGVGVILFCGSLVTAVLGLVLGVIGLYRIGARRGTAIAGTVVSGVFLLGLCAWFGLGLVLRL